VRRGMHKLHLSPHPKTSHFRSGFPWPSPRQRPVVPLSHAAGPRAPAMGSRRVLLLPLVRSAAVLPASIVLIVTPYAIRSVTTFATSMWTWIHTADTPRPRTRNPTTSRRVRAPPPPASGPRMCAAGPASRKKLNEINGRNTMNTPVHHMYCNPIQPDGFRATLLYFKSFFPFFPPNWRHIPKTAALPRARRTRYTPHARHARYGICPLPSRQRPTAAAPMYARCSRVWASSGLPLLPFMGAKAKGGCWTDGVREVWGIGIDHSVYVL
jgi:hypothetical protein